MAAVVEDSVVAPEVEETAAAAAAPAEDAPAPKNDRQGRPEREDLSNEPIDESLLIRVKGKVRRPTRPDDTERNAQVQLLQDEIVKLINRQKQIKEILDAKHSGKGGTPEQQKLRDQLQQLRTEWDNVLRGKQRLQAEDGDKKTEREKLLSELRTLRDASRGPMNLEALDAKVAELEFKLTHESLSAMDEKRTREQKERLDRTDRPNAVRATSLSARLDALKAESGELRGRVNEFDKQLNELKAKREALNAQLDALRSKESEARSDVPTLIAERKEASEIITALRKKQGEVRDAFNAKWAEFKKQERAWRVWAAHERKSRDEDRKKEYEERQAARKAMDKASRPNKYEQQLYECEQAIAYLRSLVGSGPASSSAPAKAVEEEPAPGMKLLKKKEEDLDGLFAGLGGSKKGKGAKREAARAAAAAAGDKGAKKLALRMDDLKTFMKLGVKAPATIADVAASIEALEGKRKEFEEKRDKVAAAPEEEEEDAAAEEEEAEAEAPKDPVAAAEADRLADDEDETPAAGVPAVANGAAAKGVWGSRAAAAAGAEPEAAAAPAAAAVPAEATPAEEEAEEAEVEAPAAAEAEAEAEAPAAAEVEVPAAAEVAAPAAPKAAAAPARSGGGVSVALTVSDEGRVVVTITA
ncbi:hypothetical protein Rsub_08212 [Raphidocelis subcapitata]|uniref:Uncharacterized protein n=1 Tax=Raphidocelis subcapitata TaxID=307507 RepID=A0A2V0P7F9_9CHLO|nr:hypothetical protein Rsub_08212 [Raphidocelis subcapitata]|eukprot:GBF95776.1 hypothetical protein Rsub_08212 [Raphidocelis subcapitata]